MLTLRRVLYARAMSQPKKRASRSPAATKMTKLPAALVKRAEAMAKGKIARIVAAARRDIAFIRSKRGEITAAFYDIGEALLRLKKPEVPRAFGRPSWDAFCSTDLQMSATQAQRLIDIVESMTRDEAVALGTSTKASSVAELIGATPEDDTVADALHGKVIVRGRTLDVKNMSAGAIAEETKKVRTRKTNRGRGVSEADRKRVATLAKTLRALGLTATVVIKAGLMNREANVAIAAPLSELHALGKSLARS